MPVTLLEQPGPATLPITTGRAFKDLYELVVFCPGCKTLETLSFNNGSLMPARKFSQREGQVYHDCGSDQPCRLYRTY